MANYFWNLFQKSHPEQLSTEGTRYGANVPAVGAFAADIFKVWP